jgi:hypothetical protein
MVAFPSWPPFFLLLTPTHSSKMLSVYVGTALALYTHVIISNPPKNPVELVETPKSAQVHSQWVVRDSNPGLPDSRAYILSTKPSCLTSELHSDVLFPRAPPLTPCLAACIEFSWSGAFFQTSRQPTVLMSVCLCHRHECLAHIGLFNDLSNTCSQMLKFK